LLVVGGWLGISIGCDHERVNRVSAIIFGVGGGLVGDEVGLLLTFGDYWTGITYTVVIVFSTAVSLLIFLVKYSKIIHREFAVFLSSHAGLYSGIFLVVASVAFVLETRKFAIRTFPAALTIVGFVIIVAYFIKRVRRH
jgi:Na+/phosphate symporter